MNAADGCFWPSAAGRRSVMHDRRRSTHKRRAGFATTDTHPVPVKRAAARSSRTPEGRHSSLYETASCVVKAAATALLISLVPTLRVPAFQMSAREHPPDRRLDALGLIGQVQRLAQHRFTCSRDEGSKKQDHRFKLFTYSGPL